MERELNLNDILLFPKDLVYKKVNGKNLVISPLTANWIVVEDKSMPYLKKLMEGCTIGELLVSIDR